MDRGIGREDSALVTDSKVDIGDAAAMNSGQPNAHDDDSDRSSLNADTSVSEKPTEAVTEVSQMETYEDDGKTDSPVLQTGASNDQEDVKIDVNTPEKTESDTELSKKIITQVEYYFSDENLVKDSFLMQRINRDKRGYVDLRLVASFKKMKKLSHDVTIIADALRTSKKLEVNKAGSMVRRNTPLPAMKEDTAARMVVAINFTETTNLAERFGTCGTVSRVRTISRNENVPGDIRKHLKRSLVDGSRALTEIAVVEYENEKCAQAACVSLTDSSDWRRGLHVSMLVGRVPPEKKSPSSAANNQQVKSSPVKDASNAGDAKSPPGEESPANEGRPSTDKKKTNRKNRSRIEEILQDESGGCSSSGSETEGPDDQKDWRSSGPKSKQHSGSPRRGSGSTGRSNAAQSIVAHRKLSLAGEPPGEVRARSGSTGAIDSRGVSPWVQRRLQAAQNDSKPATSSLNDLSTGDAASTGKLTDLMSVLRQPKGPDGTRGFQVVR